MEGLLGAYGSDDEDDEALGGSEERRAAERAAGVGAGFKQRRGELREEHAAAGGRGEADAADEDGEGDDNDDDDDDSDDDDDDDDRGSPQRHGTRRPAEPTVRAGASSSSLPSALDLFESTDAPSFLSVPKAVPLDDDTSLPAVKAKRPPQQQVGPSKKSRGEGGRPPPNKQPSAAELEALANELKGATKREKDRASAKDKVKHQRLSGQAGIGDDFRVWRTEQEMAMRQQFD